jgi:hypothetical protein
VLTAAAHEASKTGGYDYAEAWRALYDGSGSGLLAGLELTLVAAGVVIAVALAAGRTASTVARPWLLAAGAVTGGVALGTTKFPPRRPRTGRDRRGHRRDGGRLPGVGPHRPAPHRSDRDREVRPGRCLSAPAEAPG